MQQLLARMLHKSNPKAAAKAVDKMIEDVETCVLDITNGTNDCNDKSFNHSETLPSTIPRPKGVSQSQFPVSKKSIAPVVRWYDEFTPALPSLSTFLPDARTAALLNAHY